MKIKDKILSETSEEVKQRVRDTANKLVMKQETLYDAFLNCLINKEFKTKEDYIAFRGAEFGAKWQQERSYSEEDMKIVEISSIEANYIPHYQTKEGQFLATKFNVKQFKKK